MKILILILLLFINKILAYDKIDHFSTDDAITVLKLMDNIVGTTNIDDRIILENQFFVMTNMNYNENIRLVIYDLINANSENTSLFSKIHGLISFQNIIKCCMVLVGFALVLSFTNDVVFFMGIYVGFLFYKLFLTKESLYVQGFLLSYVTLYFKFNEIENNLLKYLFVFDDLTPVFGCLIFYFVVTFIHNDFAKSFTPHGQDPFWKDLIVNCVWTIAAIYHHHWMIGTLVIIMFFNIFGFTFGSNVMGYYSGFDNETAPQRCANISLVLNLIMYLVKIGIIKGTIAYHLLVFETGIYFWATLVGAIAFLIMSDEFYLKSRNKYYNCDKNTFIIMQTIMACYCMILMYTGNIHNISSYQNIGGTFFVLWLLDIEKIFVMKFKKNSITLLLTVLFINLYAIKQLITWYPDYFIL